MQKHLKNRDRGFNKNCVSGAQIEFEMGFAKAQTKKDS